MKPITHLAERRRAASIARGLSRSVGDQIARMILGGAFPALWDGHEVRALLADEFAREVSDLMREARTKNTRRWRSFVRAAADGMAKRNDFR